MPRHATSTSFVAGQKRRPESIERQRQTILRAVEAGTFTPPPGKRGGRPDIVPDRTCKHCSATYTPPSSRQMWCQTCVPNEKARSVMRRYGLSQPDIHRMIVEQGGHCALCPNPATVVDHDHNAGHVRGVLCGSCNLKLCGLDDEAWRQKAEAYRAI